MGQRQAQALPCPESCRRLLDQTGVSITRTSDRLLHRGSFTPNLIYSENSQDRTAGGFWNQGQQQVTSGWALLFLYLAYTGPSSALLSPPAVKFNHPSRLKVNATYSRKVSLMPPPTLQPPGWPPLLCKPQHLLRWHLLHLRAARMPKPALLLGCKCLQDTVGGLSQCVSS